MVFSSHTITTTDSRHHPGTMVSETTCPIHPPIATNTHNSGLPSLLREDSSFQLNSQLLTEFTSLLQNHYPVSLGTWGTIIQGNMIPQAGHQHFDRLQLIPMASETSTADASLLKFWWHQHLLPTGGAASKEPATTVPGSAPPEGAHSFDPPQETVSSSSLDDLWRRAFENYGLQRPTDVTEIHVFRVILQSSRDKNACTRSVTRTGPMSDPFQTLERIIDEWWDLEREEHDQSWRLSPVNSACTWSSTNELSSAAYVLTRKGNPFHFLRPHGVLEVVWGH